jgi:hypothetical protein
MKALLAKPESAGVIVIAFVWVAVILVLVFRKPGATQ